MTEELEGVGIICSDDTNKELRWCYQGEITNLYKCSIQATTEEIIDDFTNPETNFVKRCYAEKLNDEYGHFLIYGHLFEQKCNSSKIRTLNENDLGRKGLLIQVPDCVEEVRIEGNKDGKPLTLKGNIFSNRNITLSVTDGDGVIIEHSVYHNIKSLNLNSGSNISGGKLDLFKMPEEVRMNGLSRINATAKGEVFMCGLNAEEAELRGSGIKLYGDIQLDKIALRAKNDLLIGAHTSMTISGDAIIEAWNVEFKINNINFSGIKGGKFYLKSKELWLLGTRWSIGETGHLYESFICADKIISKQSKILFFGNTEIVSKERIDLSGLNNKEGVLTIVPGFLKQSIEIDGDLKVIGGKALDSGEITIPQFPQGNKKWEECRKLHEIATNLNTKDITERLEAKRKHAKECINRFGIHNDSPSCDITAFPLKNGESDNHKNSLRRNLEILDKKPQYETLTNKVKKELEEEYSIRARSFTYIGSDFENYGSIEVKGDLTVDVCGSFINQGDILIDGKGYIRTDQKIFIETTAEIINRELVKGKSPFISASELYMKGSYIAMYEPQVSILEGELYLEADRDIKISCKSGKEQSLMWIEQWNQHQKHSLENRLGFLGSSGKPEDYKVAVKNKDGAVIEQINNNPVIHVHSGNYIRVTKTGTITDEGVLVAIDSGNMVIQSGQDIQEKAAPQLINKGAVYVINGTIYYDAVRDIIQSGTSKLVSGDIEGRAGRDIKLESIQQVELIKADYGKNYKSIAHRIEQYKNEEYAAGQVKYTAGHDITGKGNVIGAKGKITLDGKNKVEIESTTQYAINEYYKKKKRLFGSSSVAVRWSISDTAIAGLYSKEGVEILSEGGCRIEGVDFRNTEEQIAGQAQITDGKKHSESTKQTIGDTVKIVCNGGVELEAHKVTNFYEITSKKRGLMSPSIPAIDLLTKENKKSNLLSNVVFADSLNRIGNMKGALDLWGITQLAMENPRF